jgi:hypothetical protein
MAEFNCPPNKYCSDQQMTEVGTDKTKIYHRTVTTLTGTGPAYTGSKTETYILRKQPEGAPINSWQVVATTTDGGKTQTFTNAAGADLKKSLSPGGNLTKNTQIQTQQTLAKGLGRNSLGQNGTVLDKISPEQQKKLKIIDPNVASSTEAGTQSADTGAAVTGTKTSGFGDFIYPEDLGKTKQDVIKFTMLEYLPSKEIKGGKEGGDNILNLGRDPKAKDRKGIGTVVLPIPAGISDTNACNWQGGDLDALKGAVAAAAMSGITQGLGAMAGAIGKGLEDANKDSKTKTIFATAAAAAAAGGDGAALLARTEGIVINPNMELLFNGPTLRPFSFLFKMSARSAKEALQIISILNFFKRGMSPIKSQSNLFLKAPHTFRIQYLDRRGKDSKNKDTDHPYIGRIKECALQSVVVSYTPHGEYATYTNGVMVSYEMQMQFQELEPIFNNDYEGLPGIGY